MGGRQYRSRLKPGLRTVRLKPGLLRVRLKPDTTYDHATHGSRQAGHYDGSAEQNLNYYAFGAEPEAERHGVQLSSRTKLPPQVGLPLLEGEVVAPLLAISWHH